MHLRSYHALFFCVSLLPSLIHCSLSTPLSSRKHHPLTALQLEVLAELEKDSLGDKAPAALDTPKTIADRPDDPGIAMERQTIANFKAYIASLRLKKKAPEHRYESSDDFSDCSSDELLNASSSEGSPKVSTESAFTTELQNKLLIAAKQRYRSKSLSLSSPTILVTPPNEENKAKNPLKAAHKRIPTTERKVQTTFSTNNKQDKYDNLKKSPPALRRRNNQRSVNNTNQ